MQNKKLHQLNQSITYLTTIVLSASMIFFAFDIFVDFKAGIGMSHLLIESTIFLTLAISAFILNKIRYKNDESMYSSILSRDFEILSLEERNKRISSALKNTISAQLIQWKLTESEIQIAFLLIKGFSCKEISIIRSTSEKTIRDQSSHIYRKAGVKSRADLAAFFLEDLL